MDSSDKDLPTSLPSSTSAPSPSTTDASAHRSCTRCSRRLSSIKYDKHSPCLNCRDVRCSECQSWSSDIMLEYLKHR